MLKNETKMAADINIRIGAKLDGLQRGITQASSQLSRFANTAEKIGSDLTTRLSLPILAVGGAAVQSFAKFERLEIGLKALADEGENTAETMARLQKIALLPGIGLEEAIQGANQLRTVGFEAKQAEAILKGLSKAVTISGQGPEQLQGVIRQFTQMSSKGRILQEDLSIILENVPSVGIAIQDAFGTQNIDKIKATGVSTKQFIAEIIKAIDANEKFGKAQGGLANDIENFGLALRFSLAELGRTIAESINLSGILQKLAGFIQSVTERFKALSPTTQKVIVYIGLAAAAIGPLVFGLGAVIKVGIGFVSAIKLIAGALKLLFLNPVGLAVLALAAFALGVKYAYDNSQKFRASISGVGSAINNIFSKGLQVLKDYFALIIDLYTFDFKGMKDRITQIAGRETGESVGAAFAKGYNSKIASETAGFGRGIGVLRQPAPTAENSLSIFGRVRNTTDNINPRSAPKPIEDVFANLPKSPLAASGADVSKAVEEVNERLVIQSTLLGDVIEQEIALDRIRKGQPDNVLSLNSAVVSLSASTQGLQGELSKSAAQLGLSFQSQLPQIDAIKEKIQELALSFKDSFSQNFADGLSGLITGIFDAVDNEKIKDLNAQLQAQNDILADKPPLEPKEAAKLRIDAIKAEIELEKKRGNALLNTAALAIDTSKQIIQGLLSQAIAGAIAGESSKGLIGLITAGVAIAGISALFNSKVPKLADGGIIPPGFEGDKFPAFLNSGEAVIPLDKLFNALGNGGGNGEFVLRGQDLVLAMNRANYNNARING